MAARDPERRTDNESGSICDGDRAPRIPWGSPLRRPRGDTDGIILGSFLHGNSAASSLSENETCTIIGNWTVIKRREP